MPTGQRTAAWAIDQYKAAVALYEQDDFAAAEIGWTQARRILRRLGETHQADLCALNVAAARLALGRYTQALRGLPSADRHHHAPERCWLELRCLTVRGVCLYHLGRIGDALCCHRRALLLARRLGKKEEEAKCLANLGNCHKALGRLKAASSYFRQAASLRADAGAFAQAASWLVNAASAELDQGRAGAALHLCRQILPAVDDAGGGAALSERVNCRLVLAAASKNLAEFDQGLTAAHEALALASASTAALPLERCECHLTLGGIYDAIGENILALEHYQKASVVAHELDEPAAQAAACINLGSMAQMFGQSGEASRFQGEALRLARKIGDRRLQTSAHINLGNIDLSVGKFRDAATHYRCAWSLSQTTGDRVQQGSACVGLGNTACVPDRARHYYRRSLRVSRRAGNPQATAAAHLGLGYSLTDQDPVKAMHHLRLAMRHAERIGGRITDDQLKIAFYGSQAHAYPVVVRLCLRLRLRAAAFHCVERSRS